MAMGVDSIGMAEFVNVLTRHFEMELSSTLLFDHPTVNAVASFIRTALTSKYSKEKSREPDCGGSWNGDMGELKTIS
jgi:hypothetical protein